MTRKEQTERLIPFTPTALENELARTLSEKQEAKECFERARRHLMRCTRQVQEVKIQINQRKEVCHG